MKTKCWTMVAPLSTRGMIPRGEATSTQKPLTNPWRAFQEKPPRTVSFMPPQEPSRRAPPGRAAFASTKKSKQNIWSYNGVFHLVDAWIKDSGPRKVLRFKLVAVEGEENFSEPSDAAAPHRRLIPSWVKLAVFKRDAGKCVICSSNENLHYDHDFPFKHGGSSVTPQNIRLLCGRHNLQKGAKIE